MNRLLTSTAMLVMLAVSVASCGNDDKENEPDTPKITLSIKNDKPLVSFVSKGSFEIPVHMTGLKSTPTAQDFTILAPSVSCSNFVFDWDDTGSEQETDAPANGLKVTAVAETDQPQEYILTVAYDATGNMSVDYNEAFIYYDQTTKSLTPFNFLCEPLAQQCFEYPVQTYKRSELTSKLVIDVKKAYDELGISYLPDNHAIYAGTYSDTQIDPENGKSHWKEHKDVIISVGAQNPGTSDESQHISIYSPAKLNSGTTYFLQLITTLGQGNYAAIHVPFIITY